MAPGIPVMGVNELVLEVVDLEAAENFYAGVLGLPVVERWPDRGAFWVMAGERTRIGLWSPQVGIAVAVAESMSTTRCSSPMRTMRPLSSASADTASRSKSSYTRIACSTGDRAARRLRLGSGRERHRALDLGRRPAFAPGWAATLTESRND